MESAQPGPGALPRARLRVRYRDEARRAGARLVDSPGAATGITPGLGPGVRAAVTPAVVLALAADRVALHHTAVAIAWWGVVLLTARCLRRKRPWIVREYVATSREGSRLARLVARHSRRFHGAAVLAFALVVVIARRAAAQRRNRPDLAAARWLRALRARRRAGQNPAPSPEEHARDAAHELPRDILAHFPMDALDPADRPLRPAYLDDVAAAFAAWRRDRAHGAVVLIGDAGMGKSTALRLVPGRLDEPASVVALARKHTRPADLVATLARHLELPGAPATEAELIDELARILPARGHRVIAVDDCHNLFLRRVGGFAAVDALARIVAATCDRVFWVLSFDRAAWDYLGAVGHASCAGRVVPIPPWTAEALGRLILTRMRRARYRPSFAGLVTERIEGVSASAQLGRARRGYFRFLRDVTGGNPRAASHLWLRSLVPDQGRRRVAVRLAAGPQLDELDAMPDTVAFVLAAVAGHDNITVEELATVTDLAPGPRSAALQYCRERGYLCHSRATGRTRLAARWQPSIVRYLARRHLLCI